MNGTTYKLGANPVASALVFAALIAAGLYFAWHAWIGNTEALVMGGREVLDAQEMRVVMIAVGALMGGAGLIAILRALRNLGREKSVTLDANRMVLTGFDLDGADQVIFYPDIEKVIVFKIRGMPVIEVTPRGGSRILLAETLFREPGAFGAFRDQLLARVPPGAVQ